MSERLAGDVPLSRRAGESCRVCLHRPQTWKVCPRRSACRRHVYRRARATPPFGTSRWRPIGHTAQASATPPARRQGSARRSERPRSHRSDAAAGACPGARSAASRAEERPRSSAAGRAGWSRTRRRPAPGCPVRRSARRRPRYASRRPGRRPGSPAGRPVRESAPRPRRSGRCRSRAASRRAPRAARSRTCAFRGRCPARRPSFHHGLHCTTAFNSPRPSLQHGLHCSTAFI